MVRDVLADCKLCVKALPITLPAIKRLPPTECVCYLLPHMHARFFLLKDYLLLISFLCISIFLSPSKSEGKINCSRQFKKAINSYSKKSHVSQEYSLYTACTAELLFTLLSCQVDRETDKLLDEIKIYCQQSLHHCN